MLARSNTLTNQDELDDPVHRGEQSMARLCRFVDFL